MSPRGLTRWVNRLVDRPGRTDLHRYDKVVAKAATLEDEFRALSDDDLTATAIRLRDNAPSKFGADDLARVCALGREAARRALDQRAFDVQLLGAAGLLSGHMIEMDTGEGKTLTGAIAAAGFALQGRRVHVVSVNDYLARRDAEWMQKVYELLGVTVGWVDQHSDRQQRKDAYACDVTYASVNEVGFDVLRDRLRTDPDDIVLPEPDVVLVDEADSVLIDEATVPLVLAGSVEEDVTDHAVVDIVRRLELDKHYEVDPEARNVSLTDAGVDELERWLGVDLYSGADSDLLNQVNLALQAKALLRRDVDYVVRGDKVELVSAARGRIARLQRWPDGLQAAVEAKEGLASSPTGRILDSIVVQALIVRYSTVCGMSGTAVRVADQLAEFYKVETGRIPTNVPCIREDEIERLYSTVPQRDTALIEFVRTVHDTWRPVLVGTQSVAESELLADRLKDAGVPAVVLNAKNDADEATLIARAGERGRVTVSTQIAGRGTDIRLGNGTDGDQERVAELGGLCVVASGRYHTGRLDDQLRGRAGRQGDPGSSVLFTSLGDDLVAQNLPAVKKPAPADAEGRVLDRRGQEIVEHAQRIAEGVHLEMHRNAWRYHKLLDVQRNIVLEHRDTVLHGNAGLERLREQAPDLHTDVEEDVVEAAARQIVLFHLDECWSEYLAYMADVREGIHLRALGRQTPIDEFHRIAVDEFSGLLTDTYQRSAETFESATITSDGVDLGSLGLQRPTSTWTYLVTDHLHGVPEQNLAGYVGGRLRTSGIMSALRRESSS
nr:accessory Sec system translocase SecA2 [Spelaeibacter cavernicola]